MNIDDMVRQRLAIDAQIKELEQEKKALTDAIVAELEKVGQSRIRPDKDGAGYVLQRPTKTVWNEQELRSRLVAHAPKVARKVFKRHTEYVFNESALSLAIDKGEVPDVDTMLQDDAVVKIVEMAPRLMPLKAKLDTGESSV